MNADAIAGLIIGLPHGWFLRPVFKLIYVKIVGGLLVKVSRDPSTLFFFGSLLATFGTGCYLTLAVLMKYFVTVYGDFKAGWLLGFVVSALAYALLAHARRPEKP